MGGRESENKTINIPDDGTERPDNTPSRANKPGRRPKPVIDRPDASEVHWDVIRHHFPNFLTWLRNVREPRKRPEACTYPIEYIMIMTMMMFCGQCGSRRQMGLELNDGKRFGGNIWRMIGKVYAEINCHPDTMNNVLTILPPEETEQLIAQIVGRLRTARVLDKFRFNGQLTVAVDGTKIIKFSERHCEHCTSQTHNGVTTYFHYVLAAKIVTPIGLVIPFAFEFIENPDEVFDKQDCEIKAFRRLVNKIRKLYPRLPITILGDGLYAEEETLCLGEHNDWTVIITLKEKKLPSVTDQLPPNTGIWTGVKTFTTSHNGTTVTRTLRWKTPVRYHGKVFHIVEMEDKNTEGEHAYYNRWITNLKPDEKNIHDLTRTGRLRWKIENEGINTQKNGGYEMEHGYGLNGYSWKNYYLILQIAQLTNDLVRFGDYLQKITNNRNASFAVLFGSMINFAKKLIECMRNNLPEFNKPGSRKFQIRLRAP